MNSLVAAYSDSDSEAEGDPKHQEPIAPGVKKVPPAAASLTTTHGAPKAALPQKGPGLPDAAALFASSAPLKDYVRLPVPFATSAPVTKSAVVGNSVATDSLKRNGSTPARDDTQRQAKVPKFGNLPAARSAPPKTLTPPQLRGRSNVSTEDLDKIFVQRGKKA